MLSCDIYDVGIKGDKQKLEVDKLSSDLGLHPRLQQSENVGCVLHWGSNPFKFLGPVTVGHYFMCEFK